MCGNTNNGSSNTGGNNSSKNDRSPPPTTVDTSYDPSVEMDTDTEGWGGVDDDPRGESNPYIPSPPSPTIDTELTIPTVDLTDDIPDPVTEIVSLS